MRRGTLIALEGVDGAGKTTMATVLAATLARYGRRVLLTQEPTYGPLGKRAREYLAAGRRYLEPKEELALFMADRRDHVESTIKPALARGWLVITDRYYYSSAAYQGALGLDPQQILAECETFAPRPDLAVILTVPLPVALARRRGEPNPEDQPLEIPPYLAKVAEIYATFQGAHIQHLDATPPASQVLGQLLHLILQALASP